VYTAAEVIEVGVNRRTIEDECEWISVESFHSLRECVVDELVQHRPIDSSNVCTCPLGRSL
jgi:hypothetical protein